MARMTCGLAALVPLLASADDRAELDRARIVGSRELPKVLHIVPWRKPLPGELSGRPHGSVLDEILAPVDRDVHRRQVAYHARVAAAQPTHTGTSAPPSPKPEVTATAPQEKQP